MGILVEGLPQIDRRILAQREADAPQKVLKKVRVALTKNARVAMRNPGV